MTFLGRARAVCEGGRQVHVIDAGEAQLLPRLLPGALQAGLYRPGRSLEESSLGQPVACREAQRILTVGSPWGDREQAGHTHSEPPNYN